jgi:hypothetical protein
VRAGGTTTTPTTTTMTPATLAGMARQAAHRKRQEDGDSVHESFDVTVPEGYEPGDKLRVEHKGRHILVVIPTGV